MSPTPERRRIAHAAKCAALVVALYLGVAYGLVPLVWLGYAARHPSFDDNPRVTQTGDGHPGDPLNVALTGTDDELGAAMHAAGWRPASALGLESDLVIAEDSLLSRPDDEAPVSNLYLFGRRENFAFEQPVGDNPRQRHHVRFWKIAAPDGDGRPIWIGSASYDKRIGLSRTTGQITHHIAADVDAERDRLVANLETAGQLAETYFVDDFHTERVGRNGGGDVWRTDGRLLVGVIRSGGAE